MLQRKRCKEMLYADEWGMQYANPTILALNPEMAVSNEKPCKKKRTQTLC